MVDIELLTGKSKRNQIENSENIEMKRFISHFKK
jgi:hypothetical protein